MTEGELSELKGCPRRANILGTANWGTAGPVSFDGLARRMMEVPAVAGIIDVAEGVYWFNVTVTAVSLPSQQYLGWGMVDCTSGASVDLFWLPALQRALRRA